VVLKLKRCHSEHSPLKTWLLVICFKRHTIWIVSHIKMTKPEILAWKGKFICSLFNDNDLDYIAPNDRTGVNREVQRVWKKTAVSQLTALYWQDSQCLGQDLNQARHKYKSARYLLSQYVQIQTHGAAPELSTVPIRQVYY
jgi:hypothetical protein